MRRAIYIFAFALMLCAGFSSSAAASDYEVAHIGQIDHNIFVAAPNGAFAISNGRKLELFDRYGERVFEAVMPFQVRAMTFGPEGALFVTYGTMLAKFDMDGGKMWETEANEEIVAITILPNGSPAVGHSYGIQAFSDDGGSLWEYYPHEECDY